ncbi:MAG TPA: L-lactate permease [Nocardioidaceae bacterium]|jgi:lactate permease|nr:L-lactate permease [Nocardioidaceae bacterium]
MFQQDLDPVGGSLTLSALVGAVPLLTLFILLGGLRMKAWIAGVVSLVVSILLAILAFNMPTGQALLTAAEGAVFGFFPIMWIVINAIWVYNLTVASGHFDVLRRSFGRVSPDHRIQAIIIAFCFGALLEALAGFGTPVAITVVMLLALGFEPIKAAATALIANTAPVAFGALAVPITTLATVSSGVNDSPRLTVDTLGAMVGRQTPLLAVVVPLILVFVVDGKRGLKQTWLPALVAGVVFGLAQFVASNYISVPLTDIVASLVAAGAIVLLLQVWKPVEEVVGEPAGSAGAAGTSRTGGPAGSTAGPAVGAAPGQQEGVAASVSDRDRARGGTATEVHDAPAEVTKAYLPYIVIIALFSIANIPAVKEALSGEPWAFQFQWPGLDLRNTAGEPLSSMTFNFNWLPAAGTLMIIAGIITALILKISPARMLKTYGATYHELRWAIVTVMAVLGLAYVMNGSGQTTSLGVWLAGAGSAYVLLSPLLGWIGVAVTGSDTSSNALFGALQVQTAAKAGLDPVLMAAANSSGGVLGKMVSPQNLAIAAAAVGMAGREGDIFRKVLGWSLVLLVLMAIIVVLQSTPVLGWMVP